MILPDVVHEKLFSNESYEYVLIVAHAYMTQLDKILKSTERREKRFLSVFVLISLVYLIYFYQLEL